MDAKRLSGLPQEDPRKDCDDYIKFVVSTQERDPDSAAVLLDGAEVIGFVHAYQVAKKPEVGSLSFDYLVPERRGTGLGARLMDYAVKITRARGCSRMVLEVSGTNARAIAFYRKHGFEVFKERDGILMMRRSL